MVTDQFLLIGAGLSLKNAENLVNASVLLFNNKFYSQSMVFASFSHEQLGQFIILEELYFNAKQKQNMKPTELKKKLEGKNAHLDKQKGGILGIGISYATDSQEGKLHSRFSEAVKRHDFKKIKELDRAREGLVNLRRKRIPLERLNTRLRSLYVDINERGDDWISPLTEHMEAFNFVANACSDFAIIVQYTMKGLKQVNRNAKFLSKIIKVSGEKFNQPKWPES